MHTLYSKYDRLTCDSTAATLDYYTDATCSTYTGNEYLSSSDCIQLFEIDGTIFRGVFSSCVDVTTAMPTQSPSLIPTSTPTADPTGVPTTAMPTSTPTTPAPTFTEYPTVSPTETTLAPTDNPTNDPTLRPTTEPSEQPTEKPTISPTESIDTTSARTTTIAIATTATTATRPEITGIDFADYQSNYFLYEFEGTGIFAPFPLNTCVQIGLSESLVRTYAMGICLNDDDEDDDDAYDIDQEYVLMEVYSNEFCNQTEFTDTSTSTSLVLTHENGTFECGKDDNWASMNIYAFSSICADTLNLATLYTALGVCFQIGDIYASVICSSNGDYDDDIVTLATFSDDQCVEQTGIHVVDQCSEFFYDIDDVDIYYQSGQCIQDLDETTTLITTTSEDVYVSTIATTANSNEETEDLDSTDGSVTASGSNNRDYKVYFIVTVAVVVTGCLCCALFAGIAICYFKKIEKNGNQNEADAANTVQVSTNSKPGRNSSNIHEGIRTSGTTNVNDGDRRGSLVVTSAGISTELTEMTNGDDKNDAIPIYDHKKGNVDVTKGSEGVLPEYENHGTNTTDGVTVIIK